MDDAKAQTARASARASAFTLAFGLAVLAFLTVIDRAEWFQLRPASGTAGAMAYASEPPRPAEPAFGAAAKGLRAVARP
jgi:hypothetical protein